MGMPMSKKNLDISNIHGRAAVMAPINLPPIRSLIFLKTILSAA